jgi:hypothetical protein
LNMPLGPARKGMNGNNTILFVFEIIYCIVLYCNIYLTHYP